MCASVNPFLFSCTKQKHDRVPYLVVQIRDSIHDHIIMQRSMFSSLYNALPHKHIDTILRVYGSCHDLAMLSCLVTPHVSHLVDHHLLLRALRALGVLVVVLHRRGGYGDGLAVGADDHHVVGLVLRCGVLLVLGCGHVLDPTQRSPRAGSCRCGSRTPSARGRGRPR